MIARAGQSSVFFRAEAISIFQVTAIRNKPTTCRRRLWARNGLSPRSQATAVLQLQPRHPLLRSETRRGRHRTTSPSPSFRPAAVPSVPTRSLLLAVACLACAETQHPAQGDKAAAQLEALSRAVLDADPFSGSSSVGGRAGQAGPVDPRGLGDHRFDAQLDESYVSTGRAKELAEISRHGRGKATQSRRHTKKGGSADPRVAPATPSSKLQAIQVCNIKSRAEDGASARRTRCLSRPWGATRNRRGAREPAREEFSQARMGAWTSRWRRSRRGARRGRCHPNRT